MEAVSSFSALTVGRDSDWNLGLPYQNLQLCFQHLEALWYRQIFMVSNASPVFTSTGGRCAKFGAEALFDYRLFLEWF